MADNTINLKCKPGPGEANLTPHHPSLTSSSEDSSYSVVTPPGSVSSYSASELHEFCFPPSLDLVSALADHHHYSASPGEFSVAALQSLSLQVRPGLMELTVSRTGRELQRMASVNGSETPNCRLTTGCVPIMRGGRILLVSSAKSPNTFMFPKGGWEQDESLPLSALRETLEEAGVTGLLGPPLESVTHETRKAAKRRLSSQKIVETMSGTESDCSNTDKDLPINNNNSEQAPTGKESKDHTHNRMTLFPLYVQAIYDRWPEETRVRRVVSIEEAINLLQHRPEFAEALQMVVDRNLHLL